MGRIEKVVSGNNEVIIVDYSDCKEDQMVALVTEVRKQVFAGDKQVCILSIFNDKSYATPKFMRQVEGETENARHLVKKQAVTGLNDTKKMILKGYNFLFQKNIPAFNTKEEALEFLLDDSTTDSIDLR
ncbi:MAG TPA: hypothetical protein VFU05_15635 [Cyclobacteriaceae bacterium]|nr:hypothetical protein [Cyclobacteriaceae bacterium]